MKPHWRPAIIGDICDIVNGGTPKTGVPSFWGGPHMWITPAEMGKRRSPYVSETERQLTDTGLNAASLLPPYSVILSSRAPIGHLVINTTPMATNQGCKGLVPKKEIDHKYLYYYLGSIIELLNELGTGTTFKELSGGKLKDVPIPIPPLGEQRRIVAILDEAFEGIATAIANVQKNIANARELFGGSLNAIFSQQAEQFPKLQLADICSRITVGHVGPMATRYVSRGVPFLRSQNIRPFEIDLDDVAFIDDTFNNELQKSKLRPGDVVIVRTGYPGTAAVVPSTLKKLNCSDLVIVTPGAEVDPHYLAAFFNSEFGKKLVASQAVGSAQKHFNVTAAKAVMIHLPALRQQQVLVDRIDRMRIETKQLEAVYNQKLNALIDLKKSILEAAIAGELISPLEPVNDVACVAELNTHSANFGADILAISYERHRIAQRHKTFGHVKAQKLLHLVEAVTGIDLGRDPVKDAAGPNDFDHMLRVEDWANQHAFFEFKKADGRYHFQKLSNYMNRMSEARIDLEPYLSRLAIVIDLLVPMDTQEAEVLATVYAAWNNLILNGAAVTDDAIVQASRDDWHSDKLKIPRRHFFQAIKLLRNKDLVPDGKAKRVRDKYML